MTIFAIDPGPHTGIFYDSDQPGEFHFNSLTLDFTDKSISDGERRLYMWLMQMVNPDRDFIICESFEFRKEDAQTREYIDYSTGHYVGVVRLFCQMTGCGYVMQTASQAKGFWTDGKLKKIDVYRFLKSRHERDAARHWFHYDAFSTANQYWLRRLR